MNDNQSKNQSTDRGRGRPANLKSGELESRVLDIAEALFAEQGFAATPIRQIADQAEVNPALIHYYFKNKMGLLVAVMDRTLLPMAKAIAEMKKTSSLGIEDFASLFFNMACKHPALPKLMVREVMMSAGETRELFIKNYAPHLGGALPGLLATEQSNGKINESFDPGPAALMVLSLCAFPFVARPIAEKTLGVDYSPEGLQSYLSQIKLLLSNGMMS
jgi:TetR/AcrR family transcriptional regulator